uniref:KANL2-like probable zinc-finger domain-containing protein n=1 Tax=Glossina morsitans morsitans TaxID=37546 RepID=A0A1B0FFS9_GLOMM
MSCQQASRFITNKSNRINNNTGIRISSSDVINNNKNSVENTTKQPAIVADDPYVFTETVPNLPPVLFNIQKSRTRLSDLNGSSSSIITVPTSSIVAAKSPIANQQEKLPLTRYANIKVAATAAVSSAERTQAFVVAPVNANTIANLPVVKTLTTTSATIVDFNFNKGVIRQAPQTAAKTTAQLSNGSKKLTNICIVRPQQQQHQQLYQTQQHFSYGNSPVTEEIKSITSPPPPPSLQPPPLYTPTPSLWQTPLLLDTTSSMSTCGSVSVSSPILTVSLPPTSQSTGGPSGTTAMAKVAPIVVHTSPLPPVSLNAKLPPSKFHQNTTAQQLNKIECLKKSKKITMSSKNSHPPPLQAFDNPLKHSNSESLNKIPVNVIFRMSAASGQEEKSDKASLSINAKAIASSAASPPANKQIKEMKNLPASNDILASMAQDTKSSTKAEHTVQALNAETESAPTKISSRIQMTVTTKTPPQGTPSAVALPASQRKARKVLNLDYPTWQTGSTLKGAVAVIKMSQEEVNNDISLLATDTGLPYCLQNNWLLQVPKYVATSADECDLKNAQLNHSLAREERLGLYKQQLRRQAMQLLSIRSLQRLPMQLAKRRLLCVDHLLRKYNNQEMQEPFKHLKLCCINGCKAWSLEMGSHCPKHIVHNGVQQIFAPCTAKFADNTQCKMPAFDITHNLPLCSVHARKRIAYNRFVDERKLQRISPTRVLMPEPRMKFQGKPHHQSQLQLQSNVKRTILQTDATAARKRKLSGSHSGASARPQKRSKKTSPTNLIVSPANVTQLPPLSTVLKRKSSTTSLESIASNSHQSSSSSCSNSQIVNGVQQQHNNTLAPPALVPLCGSINGSTLQLSQTLLNFGLNNQKNCSPFISQEMNELATQFCMTTPQNQLNYFNTNSNSNFTSSGMGSTTSLPTADDFISQDMLSMCENSSASSEDTGLGGLSDPELMLGTGTDPDDIPLGDAPLLEEHDLANVLNSLPEDAFKELFTTVHQDESDEIERAIEIADKNLKTLQQTIGSGLGDFLNFGDDILADTTSDFSSVNVSNVSPSLTAGFTDNSVLFMDSTNNSCHNLNDIRGLVQT